MLRFLAGLLGAAVIVTLAYLATLPSKADCIASGRIVDPTERHCESGADYQQLREHAAFHATEAGLGVLVVLASGLAIRYALRRHAARS
jgi:hypothetical protein